MRFPSPPWLRVLLTALLLCGSGNVAVAGGLLGTAEWGLNNYSRTVNGESEVEASSLSQNYAILYGERGVIMDGRGGRWDFNLGYELTTLDTSINDRDYSLQTSKPLYRGHLLLAPGGLPFRLDVSVEDNQRSSIAEDNDAQSSDAELITPHIGTDISDGTYRKIRATLLVGIRNGRYLGQYRDLLSQLPRLLIDYRQEDVDDTDALSDQKYRRRELAFVSLNKKDNWFHFRYSDFNDFVTGEQSETKRVILGTIDHLMTRQWVNLTNWIQVSADGSYATYFNNQRVYDNYNGYDVNLQAIGRRADFQILSLNSLERTVGAQTLQRRLNQTVYASGELDRDTAWRFQQVLDRTQSDPAWFDPFAVPETNTSYRNANVDQTDFYTTGQMETWRQRKRQLTWKGALEKLVDTEAEGEALQVGVTLDSARGARLSREGNTGYELLLTYLQGQTDQVDDVAYLEVDGTVRYDRAVTNRMAYGASQEVIKGFGDVDENVTRKISIKGTQSMSYSNTLTGTRQEGVIHSISSAYLEHETMTGWRNRLQATLEMIENHVGNGNQFALVHNLVKVTSTLYGTLTNSLIAGDGLALEGNSSTVAGGGGGMGGSDFDLSNVADIVWTPNRSLSAKAKAVHRQRLGNGNTERQVLVSEEIKYHIYTVNGFVRQLAEMSERLTYETFISNGSSRTGAEAILSGVLYPTRITFVGVEVSGTRVEADGNTSMRYLVNLNAGLRFPLMEVLCNYAVGMQPSPESSSSILALQDERREQRWGLKVKKIF